MLESNNFIEIQKYYNNQLKVTIQGHEDPNYKNIEVHYFKLFKSL